MKMKRNLTCQELANPWWSPNIFCAREPKYVIQVKEQNQSCHKSCIINYN